MHGLARDDAGRLDLDLARVGRRDGPLAVDGDAEGVDDAARERVAHGHLRDLARALDGVALADVLEVAEERDADVVLLEVEHEAHDVVPEVEQLAGHGRLEAVHARDAVAGLEHGARLADGDLLIESVDLLADDLADFFGANLHVVFLTRCLPAEHRSSGRLTGLSS